MAGDELKAMIAEIHKLADTGSYWACGETAAPTMTRARIRTLARQAEAEATRLRGLISEAEWAAAENLGGNGGSVCPWCREPEPYEGIRNGGGHLSTCPAFGVTA